MPVTRAWARREAGSMKIHAETTNKDSIPGNILLFHHCPSITVEIPARPTLHDQ
jgi:hypothetical protein